LNDRNGKKIAVDITDKGLHIIRSKCKMRGGGVIPSKVDIKEEDDGNAITR